MAPLRTHPFPQQARRAPARALPHARAGLILAALLAAGCLGPAGGTPTRAPGKTEATAPRRSGRHPRSEANPQVGHVQRELRILTWNTLGYHYHDAERYPAIVRILRESAADVIVLQEVTPELRQRIRDTPGLRELHSSAALLDTSSVGLLTLSRLPIHLSLFRPLPGHQGRGVLLTQVQWGHRRITVANTHLESRLEDGPVRAEQVRVIRSLLATYRHVLWAGDLNFGDGEPEARQLPRHYLDVWRSLRPRERGTTYDLSVNPLARRFSYRGEPSRRLDRVLLRSPAIRAEGVVRVGRHPVDSTGWMYPSDHWGLLAQLRVDLEVR